MARTEAEKDDRLIPLHIQIPQSLRDRIDECRADQRKWKSRTSFVIEAIESFMQDLRQPQKKGVA